ncbi:hypothetical protein FOT71_05845 [Klebsiella pneumoniae]|uniref:hypothetical protein n=1 Tax=Klebsiella pneumoniae TaxID=573 RepID=UPI0017849669|nr:hypothetical protein [Klebsiella pneumoniae]MBE0100865.1 hypothetical protein [Klebsiella pneumoniae]HBT3615365.1 hypothetical protein [Klebsiella pneumoniae]
MNIETVNELIASLESAGELSIREQKFLKLAKAFKQLAAENVALKTFCKNAAFDADYEAELGMEMGGFTDALNNIETPATDRIVAGIKADGRAEGINFAASRLAAAFNHGFVDKPMAEVGDVVRMILTAKEDLANDPVLAADGLSGEYAEKSLAEWEAELREGGGK